MARVVMSTVDLCCTLLFFGVACFCAVKSVLTILSVSTVLAKSAGWGTLALVLAALSARIERNAQDAQDAHT